jgi:AcrR family transcriptional regulator
MSRTSYPAGKEKLLATAERLFAELGFDGVSTKMLSNDAGLTVGAIYHHFDSKLAVYQATLEYSLGKLPLAPANLLNDSVDIAAQLTELIAWFSASVGADSDPAKLLRRELLEPHMNSPLSELEVFVKPLNRFRNLMAELAPQIDADLIQASIISLTFGISNLKGLAKLLPNLSEKLSSPEQIARHITNFIFSRLEAPIRNQHL